jgi:hypothetical protein
VVVVSESVVDFQTLHVYMPVFLCVIYMRCVDTGGSVVLYDCITLRLLSQIDAHKSPVAAFKFNG